MARVGEPIDLDLEQLSEQGTHWSDDGRTLTVVHPVEIGFEVQGQPNPPRGRRGGGGFGQRRRLGRGVERFIPVRPPPPNTYLLGIVMSSESLQTDVARDRWLRMGLVAIALIASIGIGAAWWGAGRSFALQVRLAHTQAMNKMLGEMNMAAAGLVHETKNPLNLVRGMAQMVARHSDAAPDVRAHAENIAEEVDRVASRLSGFLEYSKPRQPALVPAPVTSIIREVGETLAFDLEEKQVQWSVEGPEIAVEADAMLLRQLIFNLVMNALQAVDDGGVVTAVVKPRGAKEAWLEIRDDGPGVPIDLRERIFEPYYTSRQEGTGMGLAVVRQIVLAHRWEIEYVKQARGMSIFRVKGIKIVGPIPPEAKGIEA
jgi:signal transduction histidine kinase